MHVEPDGIPHMQDVVLGAVQRGGASLQVLRVLLGVKTGAMGSAYDLLSQVVELGGVPARESGVSLECRGDEPKATIWVSADPFVFAVAETLRHWIKAVRTGSNGTATVALHKDADGMVRVRLGYQPVAGSLPFPMPAEAVAKTVAEHAQAAGGEVRAVAAGADGAFGEIELSFAAGTFAPSSEA